MGLKGPLLEWMLHAFDDGAVRLVDPDNKVAHALGTVTTGGLQPSFEQAVLDSAHACERVCRHARAPRMRRLRAASPASTSASHPPVPTPARQPQPSDALPAPAVLESPPLPPLAGIEPSVGTSPVADPVVT